MASRRLNSQLELSPLVRLWILRLLITLSLHKKFIVEGCGFSDDTLANALELGSWVDTEASEFNSKAVRAELQKKHHAAERQAADYTAPPCLANNIRRLQIIGQPF